MGKVEKKFEKGDIVYWCHYDKYGYKVQWGMVYEQFSDAVIVDYLAARERRLVDGVPIMEFQSEQRFRKLPKNWSYDTQLHQITYAPLSPDENVWVIDPRRPEDLKVAYEKGYLVKDEKVFHGRIENEITKDGFRVIKTYPMWDHHVSYVSILPYKLYFTYAEAQAEVDAELAELKRQAELSDYDWSVEQIDKTLQRWKTLYGKTDSEVERCRNFFLSLDNVEDVEVRLATGGVQWKKTKNKRWVYVEA